MAGEEVVYYYRLQGRELNELMEQTGKVGGRPARRSHIPKVKAFVGRLGDRVGIEFTTIVKPDTGTPPGYASWSAGTPGVEVIENDVVAIPVTITDRRDE